MSNIPVNGILREVRHPAWTPVNVDGTSPTLSGTSTNAAGDWQPIGIGRELVQGTSPNTKTWKGDAGQMMTLSGYSTQDTISDDSGDGDDAAQMRSHDFEMPQTRALSCIVPATWQWLPRFLTTAFRDAMKRPIELRETHYMSGTRTVRTTQQFLVETIPQVIESKSVLKIDGVTLQPFDRATEEGMQ